MIQFKQKEFAAFLAPLVAAATSGTGQLAMMGGTTALSMAQAHKQGKEAEEQAKQSQEQMERQNELIKRQNKQLEKLSKANPGAAPQAAEVMRQRERTYAFVPQARSLLSGIAKTEPGKMAKDVGQYVWANKKSLAKTAGMGAGVAVAGYGANKYIQRDMKKSGMEVDQSGMLVPKQKQMSLISPLTKPLKGWASKNPKLAGAGKAVGGAIGAGLAFDAVPKVLGYHADKQQAKDQIAATTRQYSVLGNAWKSVKGAQFWKTPGKTTLGAATQASSFGMFGRKGVADFATKMKSGSSKWSQKLGDAMLAKNKDGSLMKDAAGNYVANKKALVGAIGVGAGATKITYDTAQKGLEKLGRKVDPNAYNYQDAKNDQV